MGRWEEIRFWYCCDAKGCTAADWREDLADKEMLTLGWQRSGKNRYGEAMWFCPDHRRDE